MVSLSYPVTHAKLTQKLRLMVFKHHREHLTSVTENTKYAYKSDSDKPSQTPDKKPPDDLYSQKRAMTLAMTSIKAYKQDVFCENVLSVKMSTC